ncbi:alpha-galactosidase [Streptomyces bauhiniae]|uniref:alpha-galactosidase n=1 Tax=Streptomyces bauhiniae TaxID=2340725 RepID=UPI003EBF31FF
MRAAVSRLRVECCAGGGGRTELGMLARTEQVWASGNTDVVQRLAIQHGFSQVYPARVRAAWVTHSPHPLPAAVQYVGPGAGRVAAALVRLRRVV